MMGDVIGNWGWLILAAIFLALEVLAPGIFLIWFSIAAFIVGTIGLFVELPWQAEVLLFAVLALVSTFVGRKYLRGRSEPEDDLLHSRGKSLLGREYVLPAPIENGSGFIIVGDSRWRVLGPDLPKGARVRVTGLSGAALEVSPVEDEATS